MSILVLKDPYEWDMEKYLRSCLGLEDTSPKIPLKIRRLMQGSIGRLPVVASERDSSSTEKSDKEAFRVSLDVQHFEPEEITVKVSDNTIVVEGKHEERLDEHGSVSRHFLRKYVLPKGHDVERIESRLSSDGVLTISAPKKGSKEEYKSIPVIQTGQPSKAAVEEKKSRKRKMAS